MLKGLRITFAYFLSGSDAGLVRSIVASLLVINVSKWSEGINSSKFGREVTGSNPDEDGLFEQSLISVGDDVMV